MLSAWENHQIVEINIQTLSIVSRGVKSLLIKIFPPFVACPPSYNDFKISTPSSPPCSSKPHKYNYDKAPYKVSPTPSPLRQTSSSDYSLFLPSVST